MLIVSDLGVRYGMHEALSSVGLRVARDEIVVILGANGAGKSTLLSSIAGSCKGDVHGSIQLDGEQLLGLDAAQTVERGIAYVPEGRGVFADLSVQENLQLGSYAEHAGRKEHNSLRDVLALFPKLEERKKQIVRTMSGGEQQMVAIGRALMSAPSILMLDEPSLGLSPLLCKELFNALKQVRDTGVGILLVEQNARQSLSISDRGYLLGNGKIIGHDSADNLLNDPTVQAAYLGGAMAKTKTQSAPTVTTPKVAEGQTQTVDTGLLITPTTGHRASHSPTTDALLNENIHALVSRATTSATEYRDPAASLPVQVVKLSNDSAKSAAVRPGHSARPASHKPMNQSLLSDTTDTEVQNMLAEFEDAARNARSTSKANEVTRKQAEPAHADDLPLPHIPVYKKSSVTVYRRDGSGKLRKQDH